MPTAPGSCGQVDACTVVQQSPAVQGFADGSIAVISHDSEKGTLCSKEQEKQKHLCHTS